MKKIFANKLVQLILFISFGVILLYLVYRSQEKLFIANCQAQHGIEADCSFVDKIFNDFKEAKLIYIWLSLLLFFFSNIIRALRWNMLFKPMGYKPRFLNAFFSILVGYFVNLGFPRAGEISRVAAMSRNENIPIEKVAGTLVVDRGFDIVCLLIIVGLAIGLEYDTMWGFISQNAQFSPWKLVFLLIPLAGFLWFLKIRKTSKSKLITKINSMVEGFYLGIKSVLQLDQKALFLLYTIIIWVCYFYMTYLIFFSFPPTAHLPVSAGLTVFSFGSIGMVIPSPGGSGSYHYLIMKGLEVYGIGSLDGFTLANLIFIPIQLVCNVGLGIIAFIALPMLKKEQDEESTAA